MYVCRPGSSCQFLCATTFSLVLFAAQLFVFFTSHRSSARRYPARSVSVLVVVPREALSAATNYDTETVHRNAVL